jgi:hypothetical protein
MVAFLFFERQKYIFSVIGQKQYLAEEFILLNLRAVSAKLRLCDASGRQIVVWACSLTE